MYQLTDLLFDGIVMLPGPPGPLGDFQGLLGITAAAQGAG